MLEGVPGVEDGVKLTDENFAPSGKPAIGPRPSLEEDGETLHVASKEGDRFLDSCLILFAKLRGAGGTVVAGGCASLESSSASLSRDEDEATLDAPSLAKLLLLVALGVLLFLVREASSGNSSAGEQRAPGGSSQPWQLFFPDKGPSSSKNLSSPVLELFPPSDVVESLSSPSSLLLKVCLLCFIRRF
jgi:hypothetical protein